MKEDRPKMNALTDVLYRVKRGLSGYISYLAASEMNEAFSEYLLYEPILRILMSRKFEVSCEHECPGIEQPKTGDKKRLDFYVNGDGFEFAIEVKWAKTEHPNIGSDVEKLKAFQKEKPGSYPLLCIFGRKSILEKVNLDEFHERGDAVYAVMGKTRYGCRIFQLNV